MPISTDQGTMGRPEDFVVATAEPTSLPFEMTSSSEKPPIISMSVAAPSSLGPVVIVSAKAIVTAVSLPVPAETVIPATPAPEAPASPSGDALEDVFVAFLIGNFLRSLEVCLDMVFQGASTSTDSLKMTLFLYICSIRTISGVNRVKPLEQLVEDFEKDVD